MSVATMTGAHVAGATLVNVKMTQPQIVAIDPNWSDAQLSFFDTQQCLEGPDWGAPIGIDLRSFDFVAHGSTLHGATLGGGVTIASANLAGLDLSDFGCAGCGLANTRFGGANLGHATFLGATGTPVGGSTATYASTICPDGAIAGDAAIPTCVLHGFAA
jgi:uncharacterized protein YjbI with pentapeptide repeats